MFLLGRKSKLGALFAGSSSEEPSSSLPFALTLLQKANPEEQDLPRLPTEQDIPCLVPKRICAQSIPLQRLGVLLLPQTTAVGPLPGKE